MSNHNQWGGAILAILVFFDIVKPENQGVEVVSSL